MGNKIVITAAVTGSKAMKKMNPAVPYSPEEIVQAALECRQAGAAIVHVHVRDPETGKPSTKIEYFKAVLDGIRNKSDMIVNLTTTPLAFAGSEEQNIEERLERVYLKPDCCSFDLGSNNLIDKVAISHPIKWGERAAKVMKDHGVKPEIEVFDVGQIYQAIDLIERGFIKDPPFFQIVMGVKWGIAASPENLLFMKSKIPANSLWSVIGVGRDQLPMITMSMIMGGHVRVGFEDNIYIQKGVPAKNNAELVELAVELAGRFGREVATPEEARKILSIS